MATSLQRAHIAGLARWLILNEPLIGYSQGPRRMELVGMSEQDLFDGFASHRSYLADCSGFATAVCRWAGLEDPNGQGYNGTGYTGTMLTHLPHYTDPGSANVGALVVFSHPGVPTGDHVAIVTGPGANPWLCSHGETAGPRRVRFSTELAVQAWIHGSSSATFLNVSGL